MFGYFRAMKKKLTEITSIFSLLQNGLVPSVNYGREENPLIKPESLIIMPPKVPNHPEGTKLWGKSAFPDILLGVSFWA